MKKKRIFLSPPHMGGEELEFVTKAFESNYIAPLGPMVDAFEREFAEYVGIRHCAAVFSGTAAMHLGLRHLIKDSGCRVQGAGRDEAESPEVFVSTLTFIGSVTPVVFEGALPVFIDCDRASWNMDPELLDAELERCVKEGNLPLAVIPTDLYGQCCDLGRIVEICDRYGVPVICDSAEALGARYRSSLQGTEDRGQERKFEKWVHAGVGARAAVFSFNGNKIITTSGGGMLASEDEELIVHARKLAQQAREDFPHYEHEEIGYNYRMSNILAAIGRGQLRVLDERVKRKREIFEYYRAALGDVPGISFMPEPECSRASRWLTVMLVTPNEFGANREEIRLSLEKENIESRPVWKPMHMQPVFRVAAQSSKLKAERDESKIQKPKSRDQNYPCRVVGGKVAEDLFERGLCLPSGTAMTNSDLDRVIDCVLKCRESGD
ncbi:DegT/DnrJ/EryC1/StrS aminotransferase family protein [delta proteobacterium NaphS2]|nr:DegT/DnrJ/EryC1/StrS aminotransferase family protein [delta proteobacterium NaphS2]